MKNRNLEVRKDMLSTASMASEILRALYFYGSDYIMVRSGKREKLIHKEQLVGLLEQGREKTTLEDAFSMDLNEPLAARMQIEDVPPQSPLLLFVQTGSGPEGELSLVTFGEYREMKIQENMVLMPEWWGVPLPLVHVDEDRVFLNPTALEAIPGGDILMARQIDRILSERIVTIKEKKRERTFSLYPLAERTYLAEDISGDFEMAEDLVWWAAIGKAFVNRMKDNGLVVHRLSANETPPEGAAEIIPCHWDGELVGRLAICLPDGQPTEAAPEIAPVVAEEPASEPEAEPEKIEEHEPEMPEKNEKPKKRTAKKTSAAKIEDKSDDKPAKTEKKSAGRPKKNKTAPSKKEIEALSDKDETVVVEMPGAESSLRKSAAKNAYGMKPQARPRKSAKDGENEPA